jgi:hypothetical protein
LTILSLCITSYKYRFELNKKLNRKISWKGRCQGSPEEGKNVGAGGTADASGYGKLRGGKSSGNMREVLDSGASQGGSESGRNNELNRGVVRKKRVLLQEGIRRMKEGG